MGISKTVRRLAGSFLARQGLLIAQIDEFVAATNGRYTLHLPLPPAGKFCILQKVG